MGPGVSTAHAVMLSGGTLGDLAVPNDDYGTVGVRDTVLTDRPQKHADQFIVTTTADHQQIGAARGLDEGLFRWSAHNGRLNRHIVVPRLGLDLLPKALKPRTLLLAAYVIPCPRPWATPR